MPAGDMAWDMGYQDAVHGKPVSNTMMPIAVQSNYIQGYVQGYKDLTQALINLADFHQNVSLRESAKFLEECASKLT